ncbi:Acetyl-CoA acetyltransferase [Pseudonocardia thermophila]|jgi:Acetyl-CoA acetyltransferase|uniref:Acetyl-CoA acetyltransferase n=1 Tax=Pseudonocardia thermophila TaxID=1848 RepID=A0A1M6PQ20_PSETH|nr:thiolase family protein [Pseudonocardia thermophila]SHK09972.1 Acetyl-CoA acetyltransferase [Pseudonocardia thermophila]
MPDLERLSAVAGTVAVVGVGETDYGADHARSRRGEPIGDGYAHAATALRRALADCGLTKDDVDGLVCGPTLASERLGEVLGIDTRWADQADAVQAVVKATAAIHAGLAETVALVYGTDQRAAGVAYGGEGAAGGERHLSYTYFSPWGLTSQGALYALLANRYLAETGMTERELGGVAVAQRAFARLHPHAVMRAPLTIEDHLAQPYICEPLRRTDYCLINDGGVALVLTTAERARRLDRPFVLVRGIGRSDHNRDATSLRPRLEEFYRPAQRAAAEQVYAMAGLGPQDVDVLQIYDSFSVHVPLALEGFGFCGDGEAGKLISSGDLGPGGRLPVNTAGGHLSGSYMQGWGHQAEVVRQLRAEAGDRQVPGARIGQYVSDVAGKVTSIVYEGVAR